MALIPLFAIGLVAIFTIQAAYSAEYLPIFDKSSYSIGESPVITIQDSSKNNKIDFAEKLFVTVRSDSYSIGKQLELTETGQNTGIFTGTIRLTSDSSDSSALYVQEGDSIFSIYLSYVKTATIKSGSGSISPILVSTDKDDYKVGEVIVISGSVSGGNPVYDVNLSIVDPHGNTIYTESVDLSYVRSYSTEINTELTDWTDSGNYKILV